MTNAVIIDAIRTPGGKRGGKLKDWHPVDLAAETLKGLVERNNLDPGILDDVIMGCVTQTGEQSVNVGRNALLAAGFPEHVPGVTIDRQCGSSQQAAHFAAQGVIAGVYDVVIAAGVESMSRVPMGSAMQQGPGAPFGPGMTARYEDGLVPQGISAEIIAERWGIPREELDQLALDSHRRAEQATAEGRFEHQIHPIAVRTETGATEMVSEDEGIRPGTSLAALAALPSVFQDDGVVTAGNSSQISDGAAAVLIMSEQKASELGLRPRARFRGFSVTGVDPITMLTGPIPATQKVLRNAGLELGDIGLFEVNEAFASVVAAWLRDTGADWEKTNVNGGAIALGHPLGATGAMLMTKLVHEMERRDVRYGLQTMCEGGGLANGTILELVDS